MTWLRIIASQQYLEPPFYEALYAHQYRLEISFKATSVTRNKAETAKADEEALYQVYFPSEVEN